MKDHLDLRTSHKKPAPPSVRYRDVFTKAFGDDAVRNFGSSPHQLTASMHKSYNVMAAAHEDFLRPYGLSMSKHRMLVWLLACERADFEEGTYPSTLSRMHSISPNTTSSLIAGLEEQGLIWREKHLTDNRKTHLRLTDSGRALVSELWRGFDEYTAHLAGGLSADERQTLVTLLEKLTASIRAGSETCVEPADAARRDTKTPNL